MTVPQLTRPARISFAAGVIGAFALLLSLLAPTTASAADVKIGSPPVGIVPTGSGGGYWIAAADAGVFSFGDAPFYGSLGGQPLNAPVVGMARTPSGKGYWLVASDGGVFSFGDAQFYGSMGGKPLQKPVVGMAATPTGKGYWLVASDGGVFSFGDAPFYGSVGGQTLQAPVVGMTATPSGKGYWLVASDGGVFSFGDAQFFGSMGGKPLSQPVIGIARTKDGLGYWLAAADGGIFSFGDAQFYGSLGGIHLAAPIVGIAARPGGDGYWMIGRDGGIFALGSAPYLGRVVYDGSQPPPTGTLRSKIVSVATAEYSNPAHNAEAPPGTNCNFYSGAWGLGKAGGCPVGFRAEDWCADFAKWVWHGAGANTDVLTSGAISFKTYGVRHGTWHAGASLSGVQVGDVIGWRFGGATKDDHVSVVVAVTSTNVTVIEGNYGDKVNKRPVARNAAGLSGYTSPVG